MLKTITISSNKKLGGCSATYRAGKDSVFSTCPSSCILKPASEAGSTNIDHAYLDAVVRAVPLNGSAWTYTHFPKEQIPITTEDQTCINISTDSVIEAIESLQSGHPTVVVLSSDKTEKVDVESGVRFIRCPAEYSDVTCNTCGGNIPLCARPKRGYVIKFTAHGSQAKTINIRQADATLSGTAGGCYGNVGPVRLQWEKTKTTEQDDKSDAEVLTEFVKSLPSGTKLRHHVVGDLGG
jgi:hypothetical protein